MSEEYTNFDEESDEEYDEDEGFLNMLREESNNALEKGIVSIRNPQKITTAIGVSEVFKRMFAYGTDFKVYIDDDDPPLPGMQRLAYVCVEGKNLSIENTRWFAGAAKLGDNLEVYAKLDGTVVLSIGIGVDEVHVLDEGDE